MYVIQHKRLCVYACVCARRDLRCIPVMPPPSSSVSFPSVFKERNLIKDKEDKMCYKQEHMHVCTNNLNNFESFGIDMSRLIISDAIFATLMLQEAIKTWR